MPQGWSDFSATISRFLTHVEMRLQPRWISKSEMFHQLQKIEVKTKSKAKSEKNNSWQVRLKLENSPI